MSSLVQFPQSASRRYEVLTIKDDSLCKIGIKAGEDFIVSCDEFYPGDFHAVESVSGVRVLPMYQRPPNLIGRVVPPPAVERETLEPLPAEGMLFNTDAGGNIVELDNALIERCWGVPARSCYGYGFIANVAPEYRASFAAAWAQAAMAGGVCNIQTVAERKDGLRIPLAVAAVPILKGASKRFRGWSGVTQPGEIVKVA